MTSQESLLFTWNAYIPGSRHSWNAVMPVATE
jgi:hypothetical protein